MPAAIVLFERTPMLATPAPGAGATAGVTTEVRVGPVVGPAIVEAAAQSEWAGAARAVGQHGAHVRLTIAGPDGAAADPTAALSSLRSLTQAALEVARLPGALGIFHEEGRVLAEPAQVAQRLAAGQATPPLDLWISLRSFELADARGYFLDTLGMAQLGLPDLEAYAGDGAAARRMASWLRNLGLHLVQDHAGAPLRDGDTLDGPEEQPFATRKDVATAPPARAVLRFTPLG